MKYDLNPRKEDLIYMKKYLQRCLIAFSISLLTGILFLAVFQAAPFGKRSLICLDLFDQYLPMYYQQTHLSSLSGLFHSWNGSLGYNNWAQSAYYCNSIFLPLFRLVPLTDVPKLVDLLSVFKVALSAAACAAFLDYRTKKQSPVQIGGAVAYSLCSYSLAFMSQIMWTDLLIYVPLVLLGLERLNREKKGVFYTLMLTLSLVTNFYIGFSVCLFLALYFVFTQLPLLLPRRVPANAGESSETKLRWFGDDLRLFSLRLLRFAVYSVLGAGLAAFVLLPVSSALSKTIAGSGNDLFSALWYTPAIEFIRMMLPGQMTKMNFYGVNIFTGTLMFVLIPLYFCNKSFSRRERISSGLFLLVLFVSMNFSTLDYIWHGLHFTNHLPGRWTFLFSLLLVELACRGLVAWEGLTVPRTLIGIVIGTALLFLGEYGTDVGEPVPAVFHIIYFLAVLTLLGITVLRRREKAASPGHGYSRAVFLLTILLTALQITDSSLNFIQVGVENKTGTTYADESYYVDGASLMSQTGRKWASSQDTFYRVEAHSIFTDDCSMFGDYKGISYFSSTMQGSLYRFFLYLGLPFYTDNLSTLYRPDSPILSSLLGIRYVLDFDRNMQQCSPGWELVDSNEEDNYDVWEYPCTLPIAFAVSDSLKDLELDDQIWGIRHQNELLNHMYGANLDVYQQIAPDSFISSNALLTDNDDDWENNYFSRIAETAPVTLEYQYTVPTDGAVYVEHNFRGETLTASWGSESTFLSTGKDRSIYLGTFRAGTKITIHLDTNTARGQYGCRLYYLDEPTWKTIYQTLNSSSLQVTSADYTRIEGQISAVSDTLVCASIAQDGGWTVYVDGKKTDTCLLCDALVGFEIPSGTHTVTFRYHVPGLFLGVLISLLSLVLLLLLVFRQRSRHFLSVEKWISGLSMHGLRAVLVLAAQAIILLILTFLVIRADHDAQDYAPALSDWSSETSVWNGETWYHQPALAQKAGTSRKETTETTETITMKTVTLISSPVFSLPAGSYGVTVTYDTDADLNVFPETSEANSIHLTYETGLLTAGSKESGGTFELSSTLNDISIVVNGGNAAECLISSVSIHRTAALPLRHLLEAVFLFTLLDICLFFRKNLRSYLPQFAACAGIALAASLPLLNPGINGGHDLMFHFLRIEGIAKELSYGHFPVRISSYWINGYGYPVSIYYADSFLLIPALLRLGGFSIAAVYKGYIFAVNLATAVLAAYSFRRIFRSRRIGLLLSMTYTLSSYRLMDIYVRAALGEYTAMIFFPLIALAVYDLYIYAKDGRHSGREDALLLALGMTGLIQSHILSTEMAVLILFLIVLILHRQLLLPKNIKLLLAAAGETVLLNLAFLVPLLDYLLNEDVEVWGSRSNNIIYMIQAAGAYIGQYFSFFSNAFGWDVDAVSGRPLLSPGPVLMGFLIISCIYLYRKKKDRMLLFCSAASVILLWISSNLFPWDWISASSRFGKMLAAVQFPWRYVAIANIFLTLAGGRLYVLFRKKLTPERLRRLSVILSGTCIVMACFFASNYADKSSALTFHDLSSIDTARVQGGEYLRTGSTVTVDGEFYTEGMETLEVLDRQGTSMQVYCEAKEEGGYMDFPVFNYKGYQIQDDTGAKYEIEEGYNHTIGVELPPGFSGVLTLQFREPVLWRVAEVISFISIAGTIVYIFRKRREFL